MATYGSNSLCVRFQVNPIKDPLPENKSQAMPAHTPMVAGAMPGGKPTKGRYPKRHENPAKPLAEGQATQGQTRRADGLRVRDARAQEAPVEGNNPDRGWLLLGIAKQ